MQRTLLNPADYAFLVADEEMRRDGLPGNVGVVYIGLDDVPGLDELRAFAADLVRRNPSLDARLTYSPVLRRPKWRWPCGKGIPVHEGTDLETVLNSGLDPRTGPAAAFYRLPHGVAFYAHHALTDEKGGERLLAGATSDVPRGQEYRPNLARHSFRRRLRMADEAARTFKALDARPPAHFPHEPQAGTKRLGLRFGGFDEGTTSAILSRAARVAGPLHLNLYLMAATFRALAEVVREPGPLVLPLWINLRKGDWSPVLGNYVALLPVAVDAEAVTDLTALVKHLKRTQVAKLRNGDDAASVAMMAVGQWVSRKRFMRGRLGPGGRERFTAYFTNCGSPEFRTFLGRPVREFRTFAAFPPRPGVLVLYNLVEGRLLFTVVFVRRNVKEADVDALVEALRDTL